MADALRSGRSPFTRVEVQVLSSAPLFSSKIERFFPPRFPWLFPCPVCFSEQVSNPPALRLARKNNTPGSQCDPGRRRDCPQRHILQTIQTAGQPERQKKESRRSRFETGGFPIVFSDLRPIRFSSPRGRRLRRPAFRPRPDAPWRCRRGWSWQARHAPRRTRPQAPDRPFP